MGGEWERGMGDWLPTTHRANESTARHTAGVVIRVSNRCQ